MMHRRTVCFHVGGWLVRGMPYLEEVVEDIDRFIDGRANVQIVFHEMDCLRLKDLSKDDIKTLVEMSIEKLSDADQSTRALSAAHFRNTHAGMPCLW